MSGILVEAADFWTDPATWYAVTPWQGKLHCCCCGHLVAWTDLRGNHVRECRKGKTPDLTTARKGKVTCK